MKEALEEFYREPEKEAVFHIYDQLVKCYVFNLECAIPLVNHQGQLLPEAFMLEQAGGLYNAVFTSGEGLELSEGVGAQITGFRTALKNSSVGWKTLGMVLDLSKTRPSVCVSTETVREIIRVAENQISDLPLKYRKAILNIHPGDHE